MYRSEEEAIKAARAERAKTSPLRILLCVAVRRVDDGYEISAEKGYDPNEEDLIGVVDFTGAFRYSGEIPHYSRDELTDY